MRTRHLKICTVCKAENYVGDRNHSKQPDKLETKKFCPKCKQQRLHKEKSKFK